MMPVLDRWVIGEAIANFDRLHASGRAPGRCSLNLAASTLDDDGLAEYVLDLIDRHGVAPSRLCFEITETEAVRNLARAVRVMERLRAVGCRVALDDFGAGMSSFRSEEHTSELQSLMRTSYAGFCLKKKKTYIHAQYK